MALLSETTINDLIEARRIDAEFFKYQNIVNAVERLNPTEIVKFSSWITQGPNPTFSNEGFDCLTGRNIADGSLTYEGSDKVDEEEFEIYKRFHLQENDILITLKGAGSTGKVGIYRKEKPAMFSRNLGVIRIKKETFHPFYFYTFLNSQHGQKLIDRLVTGGTGQLTLATSALKRLKIPIFEKNVEEITNKVAEHFKFQEKSKSLYSQAEQLLLHKLGLEDFTPEWVAGYETDFDNILEVARMDAEYFQPRYRIIEEKIESIAVPLSELCSIKRGSMISMDYYNENSGIPYLRGADFSSGEIGENKLVFIDDSFVKTNETTVKTNDIIFASIGSVGTSALVTPNFDGSFISNNTGRLRIKNKEILPEYLQIALQSLVGHIQFERQQTQTAQPKISNDQMGAMKIPVLKMDKQQQISKLVIESFACKNESRHLLEQARREVEEMIENQ